MWNSRDAGPRRPDAMPGSVTNSTRSDDATRRTLHRTLTGYPSGCTQLSTAVG